MVSNTKNLRLISEIDTIFDNFARTYQNAIITGFGASLTELTSVTGGYFEKMGVAKRTVSNAASKLKFIDESLGIKGGKIIKGSYLDRLALSQEVRQQLKNYVTSSIVGEKGYTSYVKGFKEMVVGKPGVDGALTSYYKQYAHDTYYQVESAKSAFLADQFGFDYFVYQGGLITTSREFCIKRSGKVFSREDAETWQCDPTLLRRKGVVGCDPSYNYASERGRWNCRHLLDWLGKEFAEDLGVTEMRFK